MRHAVLIPLSNPHADELRDCGEIRGDKVAVDKRGECYRAWKERHRSRGVGDTIAKVTLAFGVKPCGKCKKRQAKLNKLFPY